MAEVRSQNAKRAQFSSPTRRVIHRVIAPHRRLDSIGPCQRPLRAPDMFYSIGIGCNYRKGPPEPQL